MEILRTVVYILAFGGAILIWTLRSRLDRSFLWVGWYLLFNGTSQVTAYFLAVHFNSNFLWYNIAMMLDFGLLFSILFHLLSHSDYRKKLILVFSAGAVLLLFFSLPIITERFSSRSLTVLNLTLTLGCLLYFYELLKIPEKTPITRQGRFWIATAFLIYHVSSFTTWLIYELTFYNSKIAVFYKTNIVLVILLYALLILASFIQYHGNRHDQRY